MASWPAKDPDEVLDYRLDWTDRLESETISTSEWIVADGDVEILDTAPHEAGIDGLETYVWLSGGTLGETCEVTNRIVTSASRTRDFTTRLKIKAK